MATSFERPVGCHADIKELEYLSALAQTVKPNLRKNATLHAKDIKYFLLSRHGIVVQTDEVKAEIMHDLSCDFRDNEDDPEMALDLCEVVALLLVPHLRKIQESGDKNAQDELFGQVLRLMLEDLTGKPDITEHVLDKGFMRLIVESYGELDASDDLIQEMVRHAAGGMGGQVVLNLDTFIRALTCDIEKYSPEFEERWSTHYEDVFGYQAPPNNIVTVGRDTGDAYDPKKMVDQSLEDGPRKQRTVKHVFTAPGLDHTADTYRSQTYAVLLWIGLVVTYLAYVESFDLSASTGCEDEGFTCLAINSVVQWILVFFQLSLLGTGYIFLGNGGNSLFNSHTLLALGSVFVGLAVVATTTVLAFFVEVKTNFFNTTKYEGYYVAHYWSIIIGLCLISLQLVTIVRILLPTEKLQAMEAQWIDRLLTPGLAKMECKTKRAAAFKIDNLVRNALEMHVAAPERVGMGNLMSSYGRALLNFRTQEDVYETIGGFNWAWTKILNGTIFTEEGIWLHSRLLIANFSQFFIAPFMVSYLLYVFLGQFFADCEADPDDEILCPGEAPPTPATMSPTRTPSFAPSTEADWSNSTEPPSQFGDPIADEFYYYTLGLGLNDTQVFDIFVWLGFYDPDDPYRNKTAAPVTSSPSFFEGPVVNDATSGQLTVEEWEVKTLVYSGVVGAFIAVVLVASMLLPSTITTILKFRCGIIGSLRDPDFEQYRDQMDHVTIVFGSCFFGAFYTAFFTFVFVGGLVFVCIWSRTRGLAFVMFAQIIGVTVTILLKVVIMGILRQKFHKAFYRKKPAASNIMNVILEAWNIGLSLGYALARATKLIAITAIYLGRIDTPFLSRGVGFIGNAALDEYPYEFRKDLMLHEAHRHPYLERLGTIYMMKLYHGTDFVSRAGSCWRLLFVVALMPWMRKYRVTHEDDPDEDDSDDEFNDDEGDVDKEGKEPRQVRHQVYPSYVRPSPGRSSRRQDADDGLSPLLAGNRNMLDMHDISEDPDEVMRMRELIEQLQSENEVLKSSSAAPTRNINTDNTVSKEMEQKVTYLERKLAEEKERRRGKEEDNAKLAKQLLELSLRKEESDNFDTPLT